MTDLTRLSLKALRDGIAAKEFTALEATDAYVTAIEAGNDKLNAYVAVTADQAREMAKASDAKIASGDNGMLEGVPLGIKDLFATKGVHTQAASHILDGFKPEYESTVTEHLWADGAFYSRVDFVIAWPYIGKHHRASVRSVSKWIRGEIDIEIAGQSISHN